MRFRPCIDLHNGAVKQIVGSTLCDEGNAPVTNFVASDPPEYYAAMYRRDGLTGGHVIMLGPGNQAAAENAIGAYPDGLQIGGGITASNAKAWLELGASKVIVTSYVFRQGRVCWERLDEMAIAVGKGRLVLDLSCRRRGNDYFIVTDRWQNFTEVRVDADNLARLGSYCDEFLVHAVDVEGKQAGIDRDLVRLLADICPLQLTYAGGVRTLADMELIEHLGQGRIDATVGSALDIFGGPLPYAELVAWDKTHR